ncbi:MAG: acyl-CoA dehydrogenase family protein [Gammaproteobacteria bacterium]|nr:acyl-CoA dehydrogenase family protein [Gammaproteobacteria bacterium]
MNFGFTEEQELLRDQVRRFLEQHASSEQVRVLAGTERGFSDEHWQQMADLGWLGLVIHSDFDGVGLGWVDLVVVLEEMGRRLFPSPFIPHTLAASAIAEFGNDAQKKSLLPAMARGEKIATVALFDVDDIPTVDHVTLETSGGTLAGKKPFVPEAGAADIFLVAFRDGNELKLAVIDRTTAGVEISTSATMDTTKRTGTLILDNVDIGGDAVMPLGEDGLERLLDEGAVAITAEMIGAAEAIATMTTDYAKERIQFDHPIGKYQGVKHRLAEMYVDIESFKSLLYYAAWTVAEAPGNSHDPPHSPRRTPRMPSHRSVSTVSSCTARSALRPSTMPSSILERSKWARPMFGDADFHYERVARIGNY